MSCQFNLQNQRRYCHQYRRQFRKLSCLRQNRRLVPELCLQDQLITACKQGDAVAVMSLLQQGAQPGIANAQGEQPLGAAVWGMCPDVVNGLLKQAGGVASMTWRGMRET